MCAAPFDRNGERKSGECLGATVASLSRNLAECALPPLIGREPDWSHEPTRAEYALSPQLWLPSHELNRNSNCARYALALARAECALPPQLWLPKLELSQNCSRAGLALATAPVKCTPPWAAHSEAGVLGEAPNDGAEHEVANARKPEQTRSGNGARQRGLDSFLSGTASN